MHHLINLLLPESLRPFADVREDSDAGLTIVETKDGEVRIEIEAFVGDLQGYPQSDFIGVPVYTHHGGERQVSALSFAGPDNRTIGYVFPVGSLWSGAELPDEKYVRIFASAATRALLNSSAARMPVQLLHGQWTSRIDVTDLFPGSMGIAVLSRVRLEEAGQNEWTIAASLQRCGFVACETGAGASVCPERFRFQEIYRLSKVSDDLLPHAEGIQRMLSAYAAEQRATARFLGFYQVLEFLIGKVFEHELEALVRDIARLPDLWTLRDNIQEISRETWRLSSLGNRYCLSSDGAIIRSCTSASVAFLVANGDPEAKWGKADWAKALYAVRNLVVHRQFTIAPAAAELLDDVCNALELLCFEFVSKFSPASTEATNGEGAA